MLLSCVFLLAACGGGNASGGASSSLPPAVPVSQSDASSGKIQHVVIIFQENRTPDNLFQGLPGADIASTGTDSSGHTVQLQPVSLTAPYDLDHSHNGSMFGGGFLTEYNGGAMNNFDHVRTYCPSHTCSPLTAYGYVPRSEVQPYFQLAQQYTFADRMFQTNAGPSFPAHQYILSGTSSIDSSGKLNAAENPGYYSSQANCDGTSSNFVQVIDLSTGSENLRQMPCMDHQTMFDSLDAKGLSYKYYTPRAVGLWNAPDAIKHIRYGPDWSHVSIPNTNIFTDISNNQLPAVSWVMPTTAASDHAFVTDGSGPSWVASVVNAIGASQYWQNTAIFITWDDWGGWYDHVKPPQYNAYELGFRVPLIVVSPYARQGYVSHQQHEFGSILHFIEDQFSLPSLGFTDARADDLSDCFDFSQKPLTFAMIAAPKTAAYFKALPPSNTPVDDDL